MPVSVTHIFAILLGVAIPSGALQLQQHDASSLPDMSNGAAAAQAAEIPTCEENMACPTYTMYCYDRSYGSVPNNPGVCFYTVPREQGKSPSRICFQEDKQELDVHVCYSNSDCTGYFVYDDDNHPCFRGSPTLLAPTPAPEASAPSPCDNSSGTCTVLEDPHVTAFDGGQISLRQTRMRTHHLLDVDEGVDGHAGDRWLVKSNHVSIQARYMQDDGLSDRNLFVRAIAVGGSFVKGNTLIIGSLRDPMMWNAEQILMNQSSFFEVDFAEGLSVKARRSKHSSLVEDASRENPGVEIELPMGVSFIVNRLQAHVNVAITMPRQEGQEGVCGNFNCIASDDSIELQAMRFDTSVPLEQSLFTGYSFA